MAKSAADDARGEGEVKAIQAQGFEEWCEANPEVTLPVHDLCEDCQHRFYEATVARDVRRLTALGYTVMIGKCVVEARGDRLVYRRVE